MTRQVLNWDSEKATIIRRYEEGESLRMIAVSYGVSHSTINTYLAKWNIPRRSGASRQRLNVNDLVGRRFGHLEVIAQDVDKYPTHWLCKCDCGNTVSIPRKSIRNYKSCGCGRKKKEKK